MIDLENNIWLPIMGYENLYEINSDGIVRSLHKRNRGGIMPQRIDRAGYLVVRLSKTGMDSTQYLHRILALAFIGNLDNKPFINHINGIKTDNRLENLEWCTHSENVKHAYEIGLIHCRAKPIIDNCSGAEFKSAKIASLHYGIKYNTLRCYLNGNIKHNPTCLQYKKVA